MTTEELVDKLARPIFIFRMARGNVAMNRAGAEKTMRNALADIDKIVSEYKGEKIDG